MKKYLLTYYSNTGNSRFMAQKIAKQLDADLLEMKPWPSSVFLLFLLSLLGWNFGIGIKKEEIEAYDEVIICGPIWGGSLLSPLRAMIKMCVAQSKKMHLVISCETTDEDKDSRFGYAQVLQTAQKIGKEHLLSAEAFTTKLVLTPEEAKEVSIENKTILTEENFKGEIQERLDAFVQKIAANKEATTKVG